MARPIPGDRGLPILGHIPYFLHHANRFLAEQQAKHGDVYAIRAPGRRMIMVMGQGSTKHFMVDHGDKLSSEQGWSDSAGLFFPRGLMLRDGETHKVHRNIMRVAFTRQALASYLPTMEALTEEFLVSLTGRSQLVAWTDIKTLTLEMAMKVFFGLDRSPQLEKLNQAFIQAVAGASTLKINLPWTTFGKAKKGRAYLEAFFSELVPQVRKNPKSDLLSLLLTAEDEEGHRLTDQEVVDHAIFLLMAAHDTTASTLSSMLYYTAKHSEWQDRMRAEAQQLGEGALSFEKLATMENTGLVIKESLRLIPPVLVIPRTATHDIPYRDFVIEKGEKMALIVRCNHYDGEIFQNPHQFDPTRFEKGREEDRKCPHHYSPFGAGAHYCLGFLFADMQIKTILQGLLRHVSWSLPEEYELKLNEVPIPFPKDGLPLNLQWLAKPA